MYASEAKVSHQTIVWKENRPYTIHNGILVPTSARFDYCADLRLWLRSQRYSENSCNDWLNISRPVRPLYCSKGRLLAQTGEEQYISLMVRNLSKFTTVADLREVFAQYAPVRDVYIPDDYDTRERRSFAFVELVADVQALLAVCEFAHFNRLHNRHLIVEVAKGDRKSSLYMSLTTKSTE